MRIRILTAIVLACILSAPALQAAPAYLLSNTTLNGAITASATTLILTSASASSGSSFGAPAAGQCLFVENELMTIVSMSSTTATVRRAAAGTGPHPTSAVVFTGPCSAFKSSAPPEPTGNTDCTLQPAPWINIINADVWWCDQVLNKWTVTNFIVRTGNSVRVAQ